MPIPLRSDFDAARVRQAARASQDGRQVRRLLALAAIYEGATRTRAAEIGGVTLQIVRDWVLKFNAHGPSGLIDRRAPGQPSRLNASHRSALAAIVEAGPDRLCMVSCGGALPISADGFGTSFRSACPSRH